MDIWPSSGHHLGNSNEDCKEDWAINCQWVMIIWLYLQLTIITSILQRSSTCKSRNGNSILDLSQTILSTDGTIMFNLAANIVHCRVIIYNVAHVAKYGIKIPKIAEPPALTCFMADWDIIFNAIHSGNAWLTLNTNEPVLNSSSLIWSEWEWNCPNIVWHKSF